MTTDRNWPTGVVTYQFADIVDSTPLWDRHHSAMGPALAEHDALLKSAAESNDGVLVKTTGDGAMAAFNSRSSPGCADRDPPWSGDLKTVNLEKTKYGVKK